MKLKKFKEKKCEVCGSTKYLVAHHIVFKSNGGSNTKDNLATLCSACEKKYHQTISKGCNSPAFQKRSFQEWKERINTL